MELNVGGVERAIRIVVGVVLICLGIFHVLTGTAALVGYIIGAIAMITGLVRFCPAWKIFGINTNRAK